jgi:hypothetical protein
MSLHSSPNESATSDTSMTSHFGQAVPLDYVPIHSLNITIWHGNSSMSADHQDPYNLRRYAKPLSSLTVSFAVSPLHPSIQNHCFHWVLGLITSSVSSSTFGSVLVLEHSNSSGIAVKFTQAFQARTTKTTITTLHAVSFAVRTFNRFNYGIPSI